MTNYPDKVIHGVCWKGMSTLGSLFDGSGGFPLAGALSGITPLWASEIEPYPIAVTTSRFPQMKHLGNVTEVDGGEIPPVDIITFGSPCQDMSIAGNRAGMKHEGKGDDTTTRSGLFYEAIRIIREMREATNGEYPTFAIWENVPGAFSSNKGEDFRYVLEEFAKICGGGCSIPRPEGGKWNHAGEIVGNGFSVAWRLCDAQYWGVPQRRKRIYLVADFAGERAGKILFERESMRGNPAQGGETRQAITTDVAGSTGGSRDAGRVMSFKPGQGAKARSLGESETVTPTLNSEAGGNSVPSVCYPQVARTLTAEADASPCIDRGQNVVCYDARGNGDGTHCPTLAGDHENRVTDYTAVAVYRNLKFGEYVADGTVSTMAARDFKSPRDLVVERSKSPRKYIIRRLTPLECCRLQGFPDGWGTPDHKENMTDEELAFWQKVRDTHAAVNGKPTKAYTAAAMVKWYNSLHTDSAEYKMWGNGIALPCAAFVLEGIATMLSEEEEAWKTPSAKTP